MIWGSLVSSDLNSKGMHELNDITDLFLRACRKYL